MAINFETLDYLKNGSEKQQRAYLVLTSYSVFENLQGFDPLLIGTVPLNIDTEKSDLDIICYWKSKNLFIETLIENFAHHHRFFVNGEKNRRITKRYSRPFKSMNLNLRFLDKTGQQNNKRAIVI